jgi:hypothetical protein
MRGKQWLVGPMPPSCSYSRRMHHDPAIVRFLWALYDDVTVAVVVVLGCLALYVMIRVALRFLR